MNSIRTVHVHVICRQLVEHVRWETTSNWAELDASTMCACVICEKYFFAEEIRRFAEHGTALCPFCGCRSVLADTCLVPLSRGFLRLIRQGYVQ